MSYPESSNPGKICMQKAWHFFPLKILQQVLNARQNFCSQYTCKISRVSGQS